MLLKCLLPMNRNQLYFKKQLLLISTNKQTHKENTARAKAIVLLLVSGKIKLPLKSIVTTHTKLALALERQQHIYTKIHWFQVNISLSHSFLQSVHYIKEGKKRLNQLQVSNFQELTLMGSRLVISHCIGIPYENGSDIHCQRKPNQTKFAFRICHDFPREVFSYIVNAKFTAIISSVLSLTLEKA